MSSHTKLANVRVKPFDAAEDSLDAITRLLHQAYQPLADSGFNYVAATQSNEITLSRLLAGTAYVAMDGKRIIATITYYCGAPKDSDEPAMYKDSEVAYFGQFAVSPEEQGSGIGSMLVELIERKAVEEHKREIACDTAEGATRLIAYYEKRGYRQVGYQQWGHAVYRSVILSKRLR